MKLWVDSVRPAPNEQEYAWMKSADMAMFALTLNERKGCPYEGIDIGHVEGGFGCENGKVLLEWLESTKREYPVRVHAVDSFERDVLEGIVRRNGWEKLEKYTVGFAVIMQIHCEKWELSEIGLICVLLKKMIWTLIIRAF